MLPYFVLFIFYCLSICRFVFLSIDLLFNYLSAYLSLSSLPDRYGKWRVKGFIIHPNPNLNPSSSLNPKVPYVCLVFVLVLSLHLSFASVVVIFLSRLAFSRFVLSYFTFSFFVFSVSSGTQIQTRADTTGSYRKVHFVSVSLGNWVRRLRLLRLRHFP